MNSTTLNTLKSSLFGIAYAGAGAGAMFYSDPDRGRYRRALARDKLIHFRNIAKRQSRIAYLDFSHRAKGQIAEIRSQLFPKDVTDDVLVARVAAQLGRLVSAPHPIELTAENCVVIMSGPIFEDELEDVIDGVARVPGVSQIVNKMEIRQRTAQDPPRRTYSARKTLPPSSKLLISLGSTLFSGIAGYLVYRSRRGAIATSEERVILSEDSSIAA